jgi:hypothetical protein
MATSSLTEKTSEESLDSSPDGNHRFFAMKNIEKLREHLTDSIKIIECDGTELACLVKFVKFSEFGLNVTLQIPSNFFC